MAAFATAADMIARFDSRTLGDLCSDDDHRVSEAGLLTNDKMTVALDSATGKILAATLRAARYSRDDLDTLTGESLALLIDMTCRVALWNLWQRKPYAEDQQRTFSKQNADESLELLRKGDHVFDVAAAIEAGLPNVETISREVIQRDWDLVVDQARGSFYPRRRSYRQQ